MLNLVTVLSSSLVSAIGWGIGPYFDKKALTLLENNYSVVFLCKFIIGGIFAILIYLFGNYSITNEPKFKKSLMYIVCAVIVWLIAHYFFYKALAKTNKTSLVVLISYVVPLIVIAAISRFILKEEVNIGMITGLIICIIGICIFVYNSK